MVECPLDHSVFGVGIRGLDYLITPGKVKYGGHILHCLGCDSQWGFNLKSQ